MLCPVVAKQGGPDIIIPKLAFERALVNKFCKFAFHLCVAVLGDENLPRVRDGAIALLTESSCCYRTLGDFSPGSAEG